MSIKLKGSTDGSVTLQAPADTSPTGTDKTFTLPTADGTSGQVLSTNGSGALSFVNEGKILQVVDSGEMGTGNTSSTSTLLYNSTTPSITPSSASSKTLFIYSQGIQIDVDNDASGSNNGFVQYEYKVGSGSYTNFESHKISARGGNNMSSTDVFVVSPNTTETVTFRIGIRKHEGSRSISFTNDFGCNKVTMLEIAG